MRLSNYLKEKWISSFKDPLAGGTVEVFINPSRKEYREALQASQGSMLTPSAVRAFYDYEGDNIWIWRGDVLHNKVMKKISGIKFSTLRIVIEPPKKIIHMYEVFKSDEEEETIAAKAAERIFKFAPETKAYKLLRPKPHDRMSMK